MDFKERLLEIMEQKEHWSDAYFYGNDDTIHIATIDELIFHMQQEYGVYVRDFPRYLENILQMNPPSDVKAALLANIKEEQTGEISGFNRSHPEMFLDIPKGFGYGRKNFENFKLLKESLAYKVWLKLIANYATLPQRLAVFTIFVEGNRNERAELNNNKQLSNLEIEAEIRNYRLVRVYGINPKYLTLKRAHLKVEQSHRNDAWDMVIRHTKTQYEKKEVLNSMERSLEFWKSYREGIAKALGLKEYSFVTT